MKAVLMSIKPKWIEKIISGEKTIEVRKTKPKLTTPFKVYVYCTSDPWLHLVQMPDKSYRIYDGHAWGKKSHSLCFEGEGNKKIVGEFICDAILDGNNNVPNWVYISEHSALTCTEIYTYCGADRNGDTKYCFGWHISELKIYDKPRELGEFRKPCKFKTCNTCGEFGGGMCLNEDFDITRPPQSWYYVEEIL